MKNRAFTLMEVLIAMALAGLIMLASSSLLLSITELWIKEENIDDFQDHVKGIGHFVQSHIKQNLYKPSNWMPLTGFKKSPTSDDRSGQESLYFTLFAPHPLLPGISSGPVTCFLNYEKFEGLSIIYHRSFQDQDAVQSPIYKRLISPFASGIRFHYYDRQTNKWDAKEVTKKDKNQVVTPDFIELLFKRNDDLENVYVPLYEGFKAGRSLI